MVVQHKFWTKLTNVIPSSSGIEVDWEKIPLSADLVGSIICCPEVVSVKNMEYKCCVNIGCQKKIVPFPGEMTVKCNNPTCRRKMKVSRCKSTFTIEVTLEDDKMEQQVVTMFPNMVNKPFKKKSVDQIEDELLSVWKSNTLLLTERKL